MFENKGKDWRPCPPFDDGASFFTKKRRQFQKDDPLEDLIEAGKAAEARLEALAQVKEKPFKKRRRVKRRVSDQITAP